MIGILGFTTAVEDSLIEYKRDGFPDVTVSRKDGHVYVSLASTGCTAEFIYGEGDALGEISEDKLFAKLAKQLRSRYFFLGGKDACITAMFYKEHFIAPTVMVLDGNTLRVQCTKDDSGDILAELSFAGPEIPFRCRYGKHQVHRGECVHHMRDRCRHAKAIRNEIAGLASKA